MEAVKWKQDSNLETKHISQLKTQGIVALAEY